MSSVRKKRVLARKRPAKKEFHLKNEEISSDESNASKGEIDSDEEESDVETADMKRKRLSKTYLEVLEEDGSREQLDDTEEETTKFGDLSNKIRNQRLISQGKLQENLKESLSEIQWQNLKPNNLYGHKNSITSLVLSSDDSMIVSGSKDNSVIVWDIEAGNKSFLKPRWNKTCTYSSHEKEVLAVAISSDNKYIAAGGRDASIEIFDRRSKNPLIHSFSGHRSEVTGLSFQFGTSNLFSCSSDRTVKYWDLSEMAYIETLFGHQEPITSIDCWNKQKPLTCSEDRTIRSWKVDQNSHLVFRGHNSSIDCVKLLSADTFVSGSQDGKISLWRETKKSPLYTIESAHGNAGTSPRWITSLSAIPGTNSFVSGSYDGNIKLWVVEDDIVSQIGQIEIDGCVNSLAYSKRYVVAAASREPRLGRWFTVDDCKDKISLFNLKEY